VTIVLCMPATGKLDGMGDFSLRRLYLSDFTAQFLYYLFGFCWVSFHRVEKSRGAKLQLHSPGQSFDGAVGCVFA